jgi:type IV pilus secretin PilQ/predicted competence protein
MTKRRAGIVRRVVAVALLLLLLPVSPGAIAQQVAGVELRDVTVSTQPDSVTVLVKTSGEPKYQAELMDHPYRLVVDFDDTSYGWRKTPLSVDADPLKQIRGSQYKRGVARVVVELTRSVGYAIREESNGLAIVIPTARGAEPVATAKPAVVKAAAPSASKPAATAALAVKPEAKDETAKPEAAKAAPVKPETVKPDPITPVTKAEPAPVPAMPQVAQAPAPPPTAAPVPPAPTAPPQPAPVITPSPSGGPRLISLDFKDADVVNLLRILAAESGRNVVISEDVKGKMSITLRNVPWDLALDTVLEAKSLVKLERDNVMRIVSQDQLAKEREAKFKLEESKVKAETEIRTKQAEAVLKEQEALARRVAAQQAAEELAARGPLKEETIRLSYADPEEVARTLEGILGLAPGGTGPTAPTSGPGVIPAPPFSQLFGPGQTPVVPPSPSADVLAKGITIKAHKPTNSLFMRLYAADMERIKTLIREKLDIALPQVKIEARMEILARNDLFALGVQWGGGGVATGNQATLVGRGFTSQLGNTLNSGGIAASGLGTLPNPNLNVGTPGVGTPLPVSAQSGLPTGGNVVNLPISSILPGVITSGVAGIAFGIVGSRLNLNLALEALKSEGKTRTLARPEIVTVENNKASIALGEEIPYATVSSAGTQIQFKEAVLKLEVTPTVVREGDINRIKMTVIVENNSRGATVDLGSSGGQPPSINKRKAETQVLIKEGERLVIGGVTNSESETANRQVPLFGDIPVLGWLFKQRGDRNNSTELVVFITPSIVRRDTTASLLPGTPAK